LIGWSRSTSPLSTHSGFLICSFNASSSLILSTVPKKTSFWKSFVSKTAESAFLSFSSSESLSTSILFSSPSQFCTCTPSGTPSSGNEFKTSSSNCLALKAGIGKVFKYSMNFRHFAFLTFQSFTSPFQLYPLTIKMPQSFGFRGKLLAIGPMSCG